MIKLTVLILSLLLTVPLSSCNNSYSPSIDTKPTAITQQLRSERFIFIRNKKFGYIDRNGKIVIPARFDRAENFSDDLARVTIGKKCGFIDRNGKIVIPARFDEYRVRDFSEGLARVEMEIGGKKGFIDRKGNMVISPQFRDASDFKNGLARVEIDLPLEGKTAIDPNGLLRPNGFGYIDRRGKIVVSPRFINADSKDRGKLSNGLALVEIGDRLGYKDKNGKIVIPARYGIPVDDEVNKGNYQAYKDGEYIPRTHICIPIEDSCFSVDANFDRGLALVMIPNWRFFGKDIWYDYGYIDTQGKLVFKF
jgi:hypothetical protein